MDTIKDLLSKEDADIFQALMNNNNNYRKFFYIAKDIHSGQTRKMGIETGMPYLIHPVRVSINICKKYGYSLHYFLSGCISTALLHDCIEDNKIKDYTEAEKSLRALDVPDWLIEGVKRLSKMPGENYFDFITKIISSGSIGTCIVKLEDIEDNISTLEDGSLKDKYRFAQYYLKQHITQNITDNTF